MIKLELTVEEVNGVLQSLGNMPYAATTLEELKSISVNA